MGVGAGPWRLERGCWGRAFSSCGVSVGVGLEASVLLGSEAVGGGAVSSTFRRVYSPAQPLSTPPNSKQGNPGLSWSVLTLITV